MTDKHQTTRDPSERLPPDEAKRKYPTKPGPRDEKLFLDLDSGVRGYLPDQIDRLYFNSPKSCTRRLLKHFQNRYLWRFPVTVPQAAHSGRRESSLMYTLDEAGAAFLAERGFAVTWKPEDKVVYEQDRAHLILNNDIRISLKLALAEAGFVIKRWETDHTIRKSGPFDVVYTPPYQPEKQSGKVIPDDWITIETEAGEHHIFLEIDTGSEPLTHKQPPKGRPNAIEVKLCKYKALFHKKKVPQTNPQEYQPSPFEEQAGVQQKTNITVVFISTGSEKKVESLAKIVRKTGGGKSFLVGRYALARFEDLVLRPIYRPAWIKHPDYVTLLGQHSSFEPIKQRLAATQIPEKFWPEVQLPYMAWIRKLVEQEELPEIGLEPGIGITAEDMVPAYVAEFEDRLARKLAELEEKKRKQV